MIAEQITESERVIINRSGNNSIAQYQVRHPEKGWKTETRIVYDANWKSKIVEDVKSKYQNECRRSKEYNDSKSEPYH